MDIKIVGDQEVQSQKPITQTSTLESYVSDEIEQRAIADVLGINHSDYGLHADDVRVLLKFAKTQTTDHSPRNLQWIIRNLGSKLGSPPFPENRVRYIKNYASLLMQEQKIKEEKKLYSKKSS